MLETARKQTRRRTEKTSLTVGLYRAPQGKMTNPDFKQVSVSIEATEMSTRKAGP